MSRVSRTTLEKRQLLSIIGTGATANGTTTTTSGRSPSTTTNKGTTAIKPTFVDAQRDYTIPATNDGAVATTLSKKGSSRSLSFINSKQAQHQQGGAFAGRTASTATGFSVDGGHNDDDADSTYLADDNHHHAPTMTTTPSQAGAKASYIAGGAGGCGCEAFAPLSSASDVAIADGSFPAFLQTACLVTYRNAAAAAAARTNTTVPTATNGGDALNDTTNDMGSDAAAGDSPAPFQQPVSRSTTNPRSPSPNRKNGDGCLTETSASPVRREGTLNPSASRGGALAARTSSMPVYVADDDYDKEMDAMDARRQREKSEKQQQQQKNDATPEKKRPTTNADGEEDNSKDADKPAPTPLANDATVDIVNEVWTAEADGTISIRNASNGRHAKGQPRIPSFGRLSQTAISGGGNCFVTALVQSRDLVFAGYVDGFVRAFDVVTKELLFEKRKHAAAVTAMAQWNDNIVFSASDDFRIMMWKVGPEKAQDADLKAKRAAANPTPTQQQQSNSTSSPASPLLAASVTDTASPSTVVNVKYNNLPPEFEGPSFLHQLAGHASRIHALHVEGDHLLSGGDDGLVKCWDIRTRSEVIQKGRYPIIAHPNGGVRDITSCQTVLITAGKGGVVLYDIETAEEMKRFGGFSDVNRIMVDPTSLVLWVCCSTTGTVTLIDLYTFREIGALTDFSAATIKTVTTVASSPASRLFVSAEGKGLAVAYCEPGTTGMRDEYAPINETTKAKYETLDDLRDEMFTNERNLASYRRLLWSIRDTDQYHKHVAARIMAQGVVFQQQKQFMERCIIYVIKSRHSARQRTIAAHLEKSCEHRLRFTALLKWFLFRRGARDARFKEFVSTSLSNEHERQLIGRQLQNVMTYMAHTQRLRTRKLVAPILETYQMRRAIISFFLKWRRWVQMNAEKKKRKLLVGYLHTRSQKKTAFAAYRKLASFTEACKQKTLHITAATTMERNTNLLMLKHYYGAWERLKAAKRHAMQQRQMAVLAEKQVAVIPTLRKCYDAFAQYAAEKKKQRTTEALAAIVDRVDNMEAMVTAEQEAIAAKKSEITQQKKARADAKAAATAATVEGESEAGPTAGDEDAPIAAKPVDSSEVSFNENTNKPIVVTDEEATAAIADDLDAQIAMVERQIEEATKAALAIKTNIKAASNRETALLLQSGVPMCEIVNEKVIPKRRVAAGEESAEVGVAEGISLTNAAAMMDASPFGQSTGDYKAFQDSTASSNVNDSFNQQGQQHNTSTHTNGGGGSNRTINTAFTDCDGVMRTIRCGGFNLRMARAEIVKRAGANKTAGGGTTSSSRATGGGSSAAMRTDMNAAAFVQSVNDFFAAIKPLLASNSGSMSVNASRISPSMSRRGTQSNTPQQLHLTANNMMNTTPANFDESALLSDSQHNNHLNASIDDSISGRSRTRSMGQQSNANNTTAPPNASSSATVFDQWLLDDNKLEGKPNTVKKAIAAAHDVVVAWEFIRTAALASANTGNAMGANTALSHSNNAGVNPLLGGGNGGLTSSEMDSAKTYAFAVANNQDTLFALFARAVGGADGSGVGGGATGGGGNNSGRSTPINSPNNSRTVSPTPNRRGNAGSLTSPEPTTPKTKSATTKTGTTTSATPKRAGSTAAGTTTKASTPSAARAGSTTATKRPSTTASTTGSAAKAPSTTRAPSGAATRTGAAARPTTTVGTRAGNTATSNTTTTTGGAKAPSATRASSTAAGSPITTRRTTAATGSTSAAGSPKTTTSTTKAASTPRAASTAGSTTATKRAPSASASTTRTAATAAKAPPSATRRTATAASPK